MNLKKINKIFSFCLESGLKLYRNSANDSAMIPAIIIYKIVDVDIFNLRFEFLRSSFC